MRFAWLSAQDARCLVAACCIVMVGGFAEAADAAPRPAALEHSAASSQPADSEEPSEAAEGQNAAPGDEKPRSNDQSAEAPSGAAPSQTQAAANPFDEADDPAIPAASDEGECSHPGGFGRIVVCPAPKA